MVSNDGAVDVNNVRVKITHCSRTVHLSVPKSSDAEPTTAGARAGECALDDYVGTAAAEMTNPLGRAELL